jgi:hypothetical protein
VILSGARRRQLVGLAAFVTLVALTVTVTSASGHAKGAEAPKCTRLSVHKLARLVHQPKMFLDHVGPLDAMCTYYGVPRKIANQDPPRTVPSDQIKYYPSLNISAVRVPESLFRFQEKLFRGQGLVPAAVDPKLGLGRHAVAYHEVITSAGMQPCQTGILYDNWTGPPECNPQPSLDKITVMVYQGHGKGLGLLVTVGAASQTPPTHLTEHNVERIAKGDITGDLP